MLGFGCPLKDTQGYFYLFLVANVLNQGHDMFLCSEYRHLLPALYPGPDIAVPALLSNHSRGCFCNLLDTSLSCLCVDGELRYRKGHLNEHTVYLRG